MTPWSASCSQARRTRHRRQYDRDVLDRQWRREIHLARRRHVALPRREEHQLGRRLPRPGHGALARPDQARDGLQRHRGARRLGPDAAWRQPASPTSSRSSSPATQIGDRTFKDHLDGYDQTTTSPARAESPRKEFFYFSDDGRSWRLRYNQWKIVFEEQRAHGFDVWQDPFSRFACRSSSTSVPIHSRPRSRGDGLRPLEGRPRLPPGPGTGLCCPVPGDLQGVPAAAGGGQLLARSGHGELQSAAKGGAN